MRMQFRQSWRTVFLILISTCLLWGCDDQENPSAPPVVSKKISVQSDAKAPVAEIAEQKTTSKAGEEKAADTPESPALAERIYNPNERINPFLPLFRSENKEAAPAERSKSKRRKRIAQTPLERISLEQLKLVAIIRAASGNKALVEDSSGKGYIIKKGTYIGLNAGIVTQIDASTVTVEEELENLMGELVLQNTELKLQKPAGE